MSIQIRDSKDKEKENYLRELVRKEEEIRKKSKKINMLNQIFIISLVLMFTPICYVGLLLTDIDLFLAKENKDYNRIPIVNFIIGLIMIPLYYYRKYISIFALGLSIILLLVGIGITIYNRKNYMQIDSNLLNERIINNKFELSKINEVLDNIVIDDIFKKIGFTINKKTFNKNIISADLYDKFYNYYLNYLYIYLKSIDNDIKLEDAKEMFDEGLKGNENYQELIAFSWGIQ